MTDHANGQKVPKEAMVVETAKSIYRLGPANEEGVRTIEKDGKKLPFDLCVVTFLAQGKSMRVVGQPSGDKWNTTPVKLVVVD